MKFTRAILLIPLVLLSALHTSAQLGKIKNPLASLKNFTVEDGLPTNEIYKILEDQTGFIWICSDRGLITFDGSAFTVIDKSDGLPSNVILNIALAGDSGIYCLTNKSELFHYKQGAVTSIFNNAAFNALSVKFDDIKIRDLYVDPEDTLHIISSKPKKSTFYISVYNNKIKHIKAIADSTHSLIQYVENGITKLNAINYQFSGCFKSEIKKINKNLRLVTNTKHNLNIGKNGLFNKWRSYCLKNNKTDYYTIENELFSISDTNFYIQYADRHIFNIEQINSEIVLCTSLGLVLLTNLETENYKSDLGISQLFIDSRQNIWIATLSNGIQLIPHSVFDIKAKNLEKGHYFNTMSVLNNNVLIGTTRGNLYTFSSPNYTYLGTSKIPTRTLPITQIKHYKNNEYFVLNSSALYTYNIKSKKVTHLQKGATANQMIRHKTQIIGFKNTNTVTTIFDSSLNLLYKSIDLAKNKVDFEKYSNCYYYFNGQVLIGTNDGVYSFNPATKSFAQPAEYARFKQFEITGIDKLNNKTAIGTKGNGIFLITPDSIFNIKTESGLGNLNINSLKFISDSILLTGSYSELGVVSIREKRISIQTFNNKNGLEGNSIKQIHLLSSDSILILTEKSLAAVDIKKLLFPKPIRLLFAGFEIDDKIIKNSTISVKYNDRNIVANFKALTYSRFGNIDYAYRILPLEHNWISTKNPQINLTGLRPGDYKIEFTVFNTANQQPLQKPIELILSIEKPYYLSTAFIVFSIIAVLGLFYIISIAIIRNVKVRSAHNDQLRDLETLALRSQMNPHFFFNALNSIQSFIATNDKKSAYSFISKFAKLVRVFLDKTNKTTNSLVEELESIESYIQLEQIRLDHKFEYQIVIDPRLEDHLQTLRIPAFVLQPIIENSILHGLRTFKGKGLLKIEVYDQENTFKIIITDNGIGRKAAAALNKAKNNLHKSFGLSNVKRRIELLDKKYKSKINFKTIDLVAPNGDSLGTKSVFNFPIINYEK